MTSGTILENDKRHFLLMNTDVSAPANIRYMGLILILSPAIVKHFIDVKTSPKKSFI